MTVPAAEAAAAFRSLLADPRVGAVAAEGLGYLRELFGGASTPGTLMAVRALAADVPARRVRVVAPAYFAALIA